MRPATADRHLRPWRLATAVRRLQQGQIIAYPTEGVFGLGCRPDCRSAVERLLTLKHRPQHKGLILIADRPSSLRRWLRPCPAAVQARVHPTWPGPVTWLLPARPWVPRWLRGQHRTLAVRVTSHPLAARLAQAAGGVLVSTSANRSGRPALRDATSVRRRLGRRLATIVAAPVGARRTASTIIDGHTGRILRPG